MLASVTLLPVPANVSGGTAVLRLPAIVFVATQADSLADVEHAKIDVRALSDDIDLLSRINRLGLSKAQIQGFLGIVGKRDGMRAATAPKRLQVLTALAQALRQKRQLLLQDQPVPDTLEDKIAQLNTEEQTLSRAEHEGAASLSDDVKKLLTAPQWALLTGRSEAERSAIQQLEWLRGLPAAQYNDEAEGAADELANPGAGLTDEKVRAILDRARDMKPAVFEQQKVKLAEELLPAYAMSPKAEQETVLDLVSDARLAPLLQDMLTARGG